MGRSLWLLGVLSVLALFVVSCSDVSGDHADDQTPISEINDPDSTPSSDNTASIEQTEVATPTPIPSGSYLLVDGNRVTQVVLSDGELLADYASTSDALYLRKDSRSWTPIAPLPVSGEIVADPANYETLYLGDHPPCQHEQEPVPFHRSFNGGHTWTEIEAALNVRPLLIAPLTNTLFGDQCGLVFSTDNGLSWQRHTPVPEATVSSLSLVEDRIYGIYTTEGGSSTLIHSQLDVGDGPVDDTALLEFWGGGVVHAAAETIIVGEPRGVHISKDGGRTWSLANDGLEDVTTSVDPATDDVPQRDYDRGFGIYAIQVHPQMVERIFLGTEHGLYLSEDNGQTWGRADEVEEVPVQRLQFGMSGNILYVTTDDGVVVLNNP